MIPNTIPDIREIIPIRKVSKTRILDTSFLFIPSVKYMPNSFFRLLIKKLVAYTIKNPRIIDTNMESEFIKVSTPLNISTIFLLNSNIAFCEFKELNI